MYSPRNLVNLKAVDKGYGSRSVLRDVTLGLSAGDRIGVVGRNGDGKSTLLRLIAGARGRRTRAPSRASGGLRLAAPRPGRRPRSGRTIREELVGGRADHEWAADATFRGVLDGLLGGVDLRRFPDGMDTPIGPLSGGERRRIALARLLLDAPELLLLDEPTNHLDVEGVDWLARHLAARRGSLVVVTHDRWFLDAVCTAHVGGRRRRGPPVRGRLRGLRARARRARPPGGGPRRRGGSSCCARSSRGCAGARRRAPSKPSFRIEAANALIADEPELRDRAELLRFATARLGDNVLDAERRLGGLRRAAGASRRHLAPGPGRPRRAGRRQRLGQDDARRPARRRARPGRRRGAAGGDRAPGAPVPGHGRDPGHLRVLESLERVRLRTTLSDGTELTAAMLCDRFGFRGARGRTLVRDLSGGERRRLQLMRLLMEEPNVLLLDEPTNDLDVDTLTRAGGPARRLARDPRGGEPRPRTSSSACATTCTP